MTPTLIYIIFIIEVAIFCLLIFFLYKADKWIKLQTKTVNNEAPSFLDMIKHLRLELVNFNKTFQENFPNKPFSIKEMMDFINEISTEFVKSFIPGFSLKRKLVYLHILFKVIKNKERLIATLNRN